MKKGNIIVIVSCLLGVLLFGYILGDIDLTQTLGLLSNSSLYYVSGYLIFSIFVMLIHTLRWDIILKSLKVREPFLNLFLYRIADHAIGVLTPGPKTGGEFTRAGLLEKHNVKYSVALSSSVIDKTLEMFGGSIAIMIGVVTVTVLHPMSLEWKIILYSFSAFFIFVMLGFYFLIFLNKEIFHYVFKLLRFHKNSRLRKAEKHIIDFEKKLVKFYNKDRKQFLKALIVSLLMWTFYLVEFKFLMLMIGLDLSWTLLFLINISVALTYVIPVPLAIGTMEATQISTMALLKLPANAGVLVALLNRARDLMWCAIGLWVMAYYGFNIKDMFKKAYKKLTSFS